MNFKFKERLKGFCDKYNIKILDSNKRRPILQTTQYFDNALDKAICTNVQVLETEQVVTLEISISKLEKITDIEATFYNNDYNTNNRRMFEAWLDQQYAERDLRRKYPAVQQAYEQYSTMLNLCREKPKSFPDTC